MTKVTWLYKLHIHTLGKRNALDDIVRLASFKSQIFEVLIFDRTTMLMNVYIIHIYLI